MHRSNFAGTMHAWGTPAEEFPLKPDDNCGYDAHFDAHRLVFDLTFRVSVFPVVRLSWACACF